MKTSTLLICNFAMFGRALRGVCAFCESIGQMRFLMSQASSPRFAWVGILSTEEAEIAANQEWNDPKLEDATLLKTALRVIMEARNPPSIGARNGKHLDCAGVGAQQATAKKRLGITAQC